MSFSNHLSNPFVDRLVSTAEVSLHSKHIHDIEGNFTKAEVQLAFRNHGNHLETLECDTTPISSHYILEHFDAPIINPEEYRLEVKGFVKHPLVISYEQLLRRKSVTEHITMECSGNGRTAMRPRFNLHVPWHLQAFGNCKWTGCYLKDLLEEAGVLEEAVDVLFTGYDKGYQSGSCRHYQRALDIKDPIINYCILAWAMNDKPLEPIHGFPLRLLVPGWYGMASVKFLQSIELINYKFKGYAMLSYSYTKEQFDHLLELPVQEMRPRAVMKEPGVPEFVTRKRIVEKGTVNLMGRAWVGGGWHRSITKVEISFDNAKTWHMVTLGERMGMFSWHKWTYTWDAQVGSYVIIVRATDSEGNQTKTTWPSEEWNFHGMCDDVAQRINVEVVDKYSMAT